MGCICACSLVILLAVSSDAWSYRVVGIEEQGDIEFARMALMTAETNMPEIEGEFARDFVWSCLAESYASIWDTGTA